LAFYKKADAKILDREKTGQHWRYDRRRLLPRIGVGRRISSHLGKEKNLKDTAQRTMSTTARRKGE